MINLRKENRNKLLNMVKKENNLLLLMLLEVQEVNKNSRLKMMDK